MTDEFGGPVGGLRGDFDELRLRLGEGAIQRAYAAIVTSMSRLRASLAASHEEWSVAGLYQGYFDMTYFPLVTPMLSARGLKLAVVFEYQAFGIQVWLAARNRKIQRQYWQLLEVHGWPADSLVEPAVGVDAIVIRDVADGLALEDEDSLTLAVAQAVEMLLRDLEQFLELHDPATV